MRFSRPVHFDRANGSQRRKGEGDTRWNLGSRLLRLRGILTWCATSKRDKPKTQGGACVWALMMAESATFIQTRDDELFPDVKKPIVALILLAVLLNAVAQLLLKAGTNTFPAMSLDGSGFVLSGLRILLEPHIFAGLACYGMSFTIWIVALSRVDVSIAYPMISIGYVVGAPAAWYLFGEPLSVQKLAGIGVIIVGVVLVARS